MCLRTVISSVCDTYSNPPEESWTDARCAHSMLGRPRTPPTQDQEQADGCVCRREAEEGESPHPRNHSGMRKDKRNVEETIASNAAWAARAAMQRNGISVPSAESEQILAPPLG